MGVKMLNKLIRSQCTSALTTIPLKSLQNKKIAVDVSIYMYRYLKKKELVSSFYMMCSIFRKYNIEPIFVFDGKPPQEKIETLINRSNEKKFYKNSIETLQKEIEHNQQKLISVVDETIKHELQLNIESLNEMIEVYEPKCIRIKDYNIRDIKSLIRKYGMSYIDCTEEADVLCSKMCINGDVYAVLSEDMDIFVYGCPRVLRYLSLIHEECVLYNMNTILNNLELTLPQFKILCILAGTDYTNYNVQDESKNIFQYYKYIQTAKSSFWNQVYKILYDKTTQNHNFRNISCLNPYISYIVDNKELILKQLMLYNIDNNKQYSYVIKNNKCYDLEILQEFLQRHYIFIYE